MKTIKPKPKNEMYAVVDAASGVVLESGEGGCIYTSYDAAVAAIIKVLEGKDEIEWDYTNETYIVKVVGKITKKEFKAERV